MNDLGRGMDGLPGGGSYSLLAGRFIAEAERIAALRLPVLPDDPSAAAAMRAAGYGVLAECTGVAGGSAAVSIMGEETEADSSLPAAELSAALGIAPDKLPGTEFLAVLRETPEAGRVLSGFERLPAAS
jgi:hypothetical protein